MPNLHDNDFIAYVDHTKNIMLKQRIYLNYLSKFKRFPLETTNLHRRWLDCEDSTWQQSPNHFQFSSPHCELNSWYHAKFQPFLTCFTFLLFLKKKKKSIFTWFQNNGFTYCLAYFSGIMHPHVEKTVREIFVTIFVQ